MPPELNNVIQYIPLDVAVKVGGGLLSALALAVAGMFKLLVATKDKAAADNADQWAQRLKTEQEWRLQVERDRDVYRDLALRITRVGEVIVSPPREQR